MVRDPDRLSFLVGCMNLEDRGGDRWVRNRYRCFDQGGCCCVRASQVNGFSNNRIDYLLDRGNLGILKGLGDGAGHGGLGLMGLMGLVAGLERRRRLRLGLGDSRLRPHRQLEPKRLPVGY